MTASPDHLAKARAADSERRRARVFKVLDQLATNGEEITVSSVARAAGVHRSLIHRHGDLHAAVLARAGEPLPGATAGTQVSRQSLLADVANLTARNGRLSAHITRLERRLSEALGQAAWEASGLGAPADVETLTRRITELEQQILDLRSELDERDEDLAAARNANRELMARINTPHVG
ncbi:helix-turn-helix domain-containing protein [Streptomyces olivaceus]